jgi:hypothetical protein
MFAQPTTEAFRPRINPPDTAQADVAGLGGIDGELGTAGADGDGADGAGASDGELAAWVAGCVDPGCFGGGWRRGDGFTGFLPARPRVA